MTWNEAVNKCRSLDAHLPFVKVMADMKFAPTRLRYQKLLFDLYKHFDFSLGDVTFLGLELQVRDVFTNLNINQYIHLRELNFANYFDWDLLF